MSRFLSLFVLLFSVTLAFPVWSNDQEQKAEHIVPIRYITPIRFPLEAWHNPSHSRHIPESEFNTPSSGYFYPENELYNPLSPTLSPQAPQYRPEYSYQRTIQAEQASSDGEPS